MPVEINIREKQERVIKYLLLSLMPDADDEAAQEFVKDIKKLPKGKRGVLDQLVHEATSAKTSYARIQAQKEILNHALSTLPKNLNVDANVNATLVDLSKQVFDEPDSGTEE